MVHVSKRYVCDKCHRRYGSYHEAETCEIGHIVEDAVAGFKADLNYIFAGSAKGKAKRAA